LKLPGFAFALATKSRSVLMPFDGEMISTLGTFPIEPTAAKSFAGW
jgi:hypothetical protein